MLELAQSYDDEHLDGLSQTYADLESSSCQDCSKTNNSSSSEQAVKDKIIGLFTGG